MTSRRNRLIAIRESEYYNLVNKTKSAHCFALASMLISFVNLAVIAFIILGGVNFT